jgi:FkbM family methyltransferase
VGLRGWLGLGKERPEAPATGARLSPFEFEMDGLLAMIGRSDPVILEIGANNGDHSARFLELFPKSHLYCFEPDDRAIAEWKTRMGQTHAVLIEAAVGARNGRATFYASSHREFPEGAKEWNMSGSIREPTGHLKRHPSVLFHEKAASVRTTTLDAWTLENAICDIDFIWADVQGAEGDLIEGAKETLARVRFFYTEYSDRELYKGQITLTQIEQLLSNFRLLARYRDDALFVNCNFQI